jgi:hypothetical protein
MQRCTLVRADEFQFGFLLLTSTLYFQSAAAMGGRNSKATTAQSPAR